jgi:N-dimethylarginine dimethylaminohydrolase
LILPNKFLKLNEHHRERIMSDRATKTVVNAWNEWDPLKHVIVGRVEGTMVPAPEPGMVRHLPDTEFPAGEWGPLPEELVEKGKAQIEAFASMLEDRGIRVDRPAPFDFSQQVQTPDWEHDSMFGSMPPRDVLVTVGSEILEATMTVRSRWYEYLVYRPLLEQYFKDDPNFLWETAPKPRLTDESYEPGLLLQSPVQKSLTPEFHELFKINGWEIVETVKYSRTEFNPYCFCGPWLSNNCFSIDPKTICIESAEVRFMDQMDELGFDVIPVDFHEVSPFGGGLHCATVEIFREGECEDYFPKQIEGY